MKIKNAIDAIFMLCLMLSSALFLIFGIEKKFILGIIAFLIPLIIFFFLNTKFRKIRKSFYEVQKEHQEVLREFYLQENLLKEKIKELLEKTSTPETKTDLNFYETKKRLLHEDLDCAKKDYDKFLAKRPKFIINYVTK